MKSNDLIIRGNQAPATSFSFHTIANSHAPKELKWYVTLNLKSFNLPLNQNFGWYTGYVSRKKKNPKPTYFIIKGSTIFLYAF